jgi:hypothetical protein
VEELVSEEESDNEDEDVSEDDEDVLGDDETLLEEDLLYHDDTPEDTSELEDDLIDESLSEDALNIDNLPEDELMGGHIEPVKTHQPDTSQPFEKGENVLNLPSTIKDELSAVLCYMDQLLEALPDEKIAEFAQSEYFDTYKKLFKELGLG